MLSVFPISNPFTRMGAGVCGAAPSLRPPCAVVRVNAVVKEVCRPTTPPSEAVSDWVLPTNHPSNVSCSDVTCSNTTSSRDTEGILSIENVTTCSNTSSEWTDQSGALDVETCSMSSSSVGSVVLSEWDTCSMSSSSVASSELIDMVNDITSAVCDQTSTGQTAYELYSRYLAEVRCVEEQENAVHVVQRLLCNFTSTIQKMFNISLETAGTSERRRVLELNHYTAAMKSKNETIQQLEEECEKKKEGQHMEEVTPVEVKVRIPKWYRRLLVYRHCGGEDPLPPWIGNSCLEIPPQYMEVYCHYYGSE